MNTHAKHGTAAMIGAVKAGQRRLGLEGQTYKDFLFRETGKDSCADMNARELGKVLNAMRAAGFGQKADANPLTPRQKALVRALWREMHKLGIVRNPNDSALDAYAARICRYPLEALTVKQFQSLIESMKRWWDRELGVAGAARWAIVCAGYEAAKGLAPGTLGDAGDYGVPQ
jgi:phage gp16-like protein